MKLRLILIPPVLMTGLWACAPKSEEKKEASVQYPGIDSNGVCRQVTIETANGINEAFRLYAASNDKNQLFRIKLLCDDLHSLILDQSCHAVIKDTDTPAPISYEEYRKDCEWAKSQP